MMDGERSGDCALACGGACVGVCGAPICSSCACEGTQTGESEGQLDEVLFFQSDDFPTYMQKM